MNAPSTATKNLHDFGLLPARELAQIALATGIDRSWLREIFRLERAPTEAQMEALEEHIPGSVVVELEVSRLPKEEQAEALRRVADIGKLLTCGTDRTPEILSRALELQAAAGTSPTAAKELDFTLAAFDLAARGTLHFVAPLLRLTPGSDSTSPSAPR